MTSYEKKAKEMLRQIRKQQEMLDSWMRALRKVDPEDDETRMKLAAQMVAESEGL